MTVSNALLGGLSFILRVVLSPALAVGWVLENLGKGIVFDGFTLLRNPKNAVTQMIAYYLYFRNTGSYVVN